VEFLMTTSTNLLPSLMVKILTTALQADNGPPTSLATPTAYVHYCYRNV